MKRKLTYLLGLLIVTSAVWAEDCPVQAELLGNGGYMQVNPSADFIVTMRRDTAWSFLNPPYSEKPAPNVDVYEVFAAQHNANVIAKFTYIPTIENPYLVCWYAKKRSYTGDVISCSLYAMDSHGDTLKNCGAPSYYESTSESNAFGWQFTKMDLSAYIGQEISVYAQTTSCAQGGVCTFYWFLAFQCYGDNPEDVDMTRYLCSQGETITLQAPISDTYEWHMSTPSGPIVGTNRELVIADPAMITNYYCPVKDFCGETKLYSAIVQDVHAVFNYDLHCGKVNDTVFLTNKSFKQKRVSPYTKEPVDAVFWDFGNGTTSTAQQPGYVVYPKGQEVTIQLHAGTENFDCDAWKTATFRTCDREDSIPLNPLPLIPVTDSIDSVVCHGTIVEWRDMYLSETGIYRDTLLSKMWGIDSIYYVLNLTVLTEPVEIPLLDTASCQMVPFMWRGHAIVGDTTCYDTIRTTKLDCDSIYASLRFAVKEPSSSDTTAYTCYGTPFIWHGKVAQDGDTIVRRNAQGCDSVVTLKLITNPTYNQEVNLTVCAKQMPYTWNGIKCETAGDYVLDSITILGCDSIVTLHLSVDTYSASDTSAYICYEDLPFIWHGKIAQDGDTIHLINSVGCDSIVTLKLFVSEAPVTLPQKDTASCQMVPFLWRGHQIASDTLCYDTIRTIKLGCDSIYSSLRFVVKEPSASDTSAYVCYEDLPFIWHGKTAKDGDTIMLINRAGCDSIVTLRLTTSTKPIVWNIDTTICDTLLPFKWREYTFTAIYTYRDTIYNARGCDSIYRSFTLDTVHCVRPEPPVPPEPPVDTCVSNLVYRKWVDFIFCDNGRDEFVAFQWYRNNQYLAGETGQYLYLPQTMGAAEYFVEATKTDGSKIRTCPMTFDNTPRSRDTYVQVTTVIRRGEPLQIAMSDPEADITIYTVVGQSVLAAHILGPETSLPIALPAGTYVLRLIGANVNTTTKILIE